MENLDQADPEQPDPEQIQQPLDQQDNPVELPELSAAAAGEAAISESQSAPEDEHVVQGAAQLPQAAADQWDALHREVRLDGKKLFISKSSTKYF